MLKAVDEVKKSCLDQARNTLESKSVAFSYRPHPNNIDGPLFDCITPFDLSTSIKSRASHARAFVDRFCFPILQFSSSHTPLLFP